MSSPRHDALPHLCTAVQETPWRKASRIRRSHLGLPLSVSSGSFEAQLFSFVAEWRGEVLRALLSQGLSCSRCTRRNLGVRGMRWSRLFHQRHTKAGPQEWFGSKRPDGCKARLHYLQGSRCPHPYDWGVVRRGRAVLNSGRALLPRYVLS
jgi:hypothetical protein